MKWFKSKLLKYGILTLLLFLPSCIGGSSEEYYETYYAFIHRWEELSRFLPENSTHIRHYAVGDFDTNYHFIEATALLKDLETFVKSKNYYDSQFTHAGVQYSDQQFDELFYERPLWWNEQSIRNYQDNILFLFPNDDDYRRGYWLFYDKIDSKIRVFIWGQQWQTMEGVKKVLL